MLARTDLPDSAFEVVGTSSSTYAVPLELPTLTGTLTIHRGWTAADLLVGGVPVRVVNTHLERLYGPIQELEALELISGPAGVPGRVVVLGDLNSAAGGVGAVPGESDTRTYQWLLDAGFSDAWTQKHGADPGLTCCYAENLRDPQALTERIDLVVARGGVSARSVVRIGDEPADRTSSGMWPTDHAGLVAVLRLS